MDLVVNAQNPSTQEVETVRSGVQGQLHNELEASHESQTLKRHNNGQT